MICDLRVFNARFSATVQTFDETIRKNEIVPTGEALLIEITAAFRYRYVEAKSHAQAASILTRALADVCEVLKKKLIEEANGLNIAIVTIKPVETEHWPPLLLSKATGPNGIPRIVIDNVDLHW